MFSPSGGEPKNLFQSQVSRGAPGEAEGPVLLLWTLNDRLGKYERSFLKVAQEWLCHDTESVFEYLNRSDP